MAYRPVIHLQLFFFLSFPFIILYPCSASVLSGLHTHVDVCSPSYYRIRSLCIISDYHALIYLDQACFLTFPSSSCLPSSSPLPLPPPPPTLPKHTSLFFFGNLYYPWVCCRHFLVYYICTFPPRFFLSFFPYSHPPSPSHNRFLYIQSRTIEARTNRFFLAVYS